LSAANLKFLKRKERELGEAVSPQTSLLGEITHSTNILYTTYRGAQRRGNKHPGTHRLENYSNMRDEQVARPGRPFLDNPIGGTLSVLSRLQRPTTPS